MEILKEILRIVTTKSDKAKVFPELIEDDEASTSLLPGGSSMEWPMTRTPRTKKLHGTSTGPGPVTNAIEP
ncbi:MAG: hypothetical protein IPP80_00785 [Ignavibacteria bacterium]|nr:hypothetical protein [Ignavibacteria bacterium]